MTKTNKQLHAYGRRMSRTSVRDLSHFDRVLGSTLGPERYAHFLDGWTYEATRDDEYAYGHPSNSTPA